MADIAATRPGACTPFDWQLAGAGEQELTKHHVIFPCQGIFSEIQLQDIYALEPDGGLDTAVILSLFSDSRATDDDRLPLGQTDRRGWCGSEYMSDDDHEWGSHLWLGYYTKTTVERLRFMEFAAKESLKWLIDQSIVSQVDVTASWLEDGRLALHVQIHQLEDSDPVYDVVWATTLRSHAHA